MISKIAQEVITIIINDYQNSVVSLSFGSMVPSSDDCRLFRIHGTLKSSDEGTMDPKL